MAKSLNDGMQILVGGMQVLVGQIPRIKTLLFSNAAFTCAFKAVSTITQPGGTLSTLKVFSGSHDQVLIKENSKKKCTPE